MSTATAAALAAMIAPFATVALLLIFCGVAGLIRHFALRK